MGGCEDSLSSYVRNPWDSGMVTPEVSMDPTICLPQEVAS